MDLCLRPLHSEVNKPTADLVESPSDFLERCRDLFQFLGSPLGSRGNRLPPDRFGPPHASFAVRVHLWSAPVHGRQLGSESLLGLLFVLAGQLPLEAVASGPGPPHGVEGPVGRGGDDGG